MKNRTPYWGGGVIGGLGFFFMASLRVSGGLRGMSESVWKVYAEHKEGV